MCGATGAAPNGSSEEDTVPSELFFEFFVRHRFEFFWILPFHRPDVVPVLKDIRALDITLAGYSVQTGVEEILESEFFSVHI